MVAQVKCAIEALSDHGSYTPMLVSNRCGCQYVYVKAGEQPNGSALAAAIAGASEVPEEILAIRQSKREDLRELVRTNLPRLLDLQDEVGSLPSYGGESATRSELNPAIVEAATEDYDRVRSERALDVMNEMERTLMQRIALGLHNEHIEDRHMLSAQSTFALTGNHWRLVYGGEEALVSHCKGMAYLQMLLSKPKQRITCEELEGKGMSGAEAVEGERAIPITDQKSLVAVRSRLKDIRNALRDPESVLSMEEREAMEVEALELENYLSKGGRQNGTPRATGGSKSRLVNRVRKAIADAISKIAEEIPELGKHLRESILDRGGEAPMYSPSCETQWSLI